MALNRRRSEDDNGSALNTNSTDELAAISDLKRGAGEMMVIGPIFVPIFRPLIRQLVKHEIELANQESLIRNPKNKASTSVLKKLKLQFRNKIALPVLTGMPLLGENNTPIEIAMIDALTGEIVTTGDGSAAKLELLGFRVGDDDGSWTYEDVQGRILSARNDRRILQGDTRLQLKEGVGSVRKISFTHNSKHTRNGVYRLVAVIVDDGLMNEVEVEVAQTETFKMKDKHSTYREKRPCPALSDKVLRLQKISHNGTRYKSLQKAEVYTVKDLLRLLYTDPKRLEEILELKASCKCWDDIVKNAQASSGMFLYLDPRNEHKTGVVLDAKLQLKAVIAERHLYIAVNQLSEQQKVETQDLVKFASEHFDMLRPFEQESSLQEHLQQGTSLPSFRITDRPPRPSSQVAKALRDLNNLNHKPFVTTQSQRGKEKVPSDDEMNSTNDHQVYIPNRLNFGTATEPGTSSRAVESLFDTRDFMDMSDIIGPMFSESQLFSFLKDCYDVLNESPNECQSNPATVSFCHIARARWTKVSKLLRRNSVRERISLSQGIQPLKKQRCC